MPSGSWRGTTLKKVDQYTVEWTFKEAFPRQHLYAMAYGTFCPGPSHILKAKHPKYAGTTYDQYKNAPEVTRRRMFIETMEKVMGGTDKIILDSKGGGSGVVPYLPLDRLQTRTPATTEEGN